MCSTIIWARRKWMHLHVPAVLSPSGSYHTECKYWHQANYFHFLCACNVKKSCDVSLMVKTAASLCYYSTGSLDLWDYQVLTFKSASVSVNVETQKIIFPWKQSWTYLFSLSDSNLTNVWYFGNWHAGSTNCKLKKTKLLTVIRIQALYWRLWCVSSDKIYYKKYPPTVSGTSIMCCKNKVTEIRSW